MIRIFDVLISLIGIIILFPILIIIYILIIIESRGGGLYLQNRVGKDGIDFKLYKFRSMRVGSDKKGLITIGGRDPRMTRIGFFIRRFKLDELPQLFNVLEGKMSIVGPRPEVKKYVELYNETERQVLTVKPGITDYASIEFANENELLGSVTNPEDVYIKEIMPKKINMNMKYINNQSLPEYFKIIILTIKKIMS